MYFATYELCCTSNYPEIGIILTISAQNMQVDTFMSDLLPKYYQEMQFKYESYGAHLELEVLKHTKPT